MNVLVGEGTGGFADLLERLGWGRMWIARTRNIHTYPGEPWGLDNGAYGDWINGRAFDEDAWLRVVTKAQSVPNPPYLAVLPDIVIRYLQTGDESIRDAAGAAARDAAWDAAGAAAWGRQNRRLTAMVSAKHGRILEGEGDHDD